MTEVIAQITRTQNLSDLVSQNPASFENLGDKDRAEVMLRLTPEVLSQVSGKPLSPVDARQITESKVALKALDFYKMEFASAGPEGLDIIGPVESRTNLQATLRQRLLSWNSCKAIWLLLYALCASRE